MRYFLIKRMTANSSDVEIVAGVNLIPLAPDLAVGALEAFRFPTLFLAITFAQGLKLKSDELIVITCHREIDGQPQAIIAATVIFNRDGSSTVSERLTQPYLVEKPEGFYGPFPTADAALKYALGHPWSIVPLFKP